MSHAAGTVNGVLTDLRISPLSRVVRSRCGGWAIDQLKIATDEESGILNDANQWDAWADDPGQLILHLKRLVRVSVETSGIVRGLPPALSKQ